MINRSQLRNTLRQQRQTLSAGKAASAARQLTERVIQHPAFINSTSIAAYLAHQGEIDPIDIMYAAWELKKSVYIPTLHPTKPYHLQFVQWTPNIPLTINRYGIFEPKGAEALAKAAPTVENLDLVLLPLVGFDINCNRLGTGGGYYDRTFAFLNQTPRPAKPLLIGLAYDFQRTDELEIEPWDVPLDEVITNVSCQRRLASSQKSF